MRLISHASLKHLNSFGIAATARFLVQVHNEAELRTFVQSVTAKNLPVLVLGGGSNIVFSQDYQGVVLNPNFKGVKCIVDDSERVIVEAAAGENWHEFVQYCLAQGWYGLENLSLIAGTVGAAPIQNIGAYGVEVKDFIHSVKGFDFETNDLLARSCMMFWCLSSISFMLFSRSEISLLLYILDIMDSCM